MTIAIFMFIDCCHSYSSQPRWINSARVESEEKKTKKVITLERFYRLHPSISAAESSVSVNNELRIAAQGANESLHFNQLPNNEIASWAFFFHKDVDLYLPGAVLHSGDPPVRLTTLQRPR